MKKNKHFHTINKKFWVCTINTLLVLGGLFVHVRKLVGRKYMRCDRVKSLVSTILVYISFKKKRFTNKRTHTDFGMNEHASYLLQNLSRTA